MAVKRITDEEKPMKEPKKLGRPTIVTPELVTKAWQYLSNWKRMGEAIPTVEGCAIYLGIHRDVMYSHKDAFNDILGEIKQAQAFTLQNGSLKGELNPVISKLILSAKHDYAEKSAQDLTTNGKDLPAPILGSASVNVPSDNRNS